MKKIVAMWCLSASVLGAESAGQETAALPWQRLNMPTAARVSATWLNPPSEYGPEPYFDMGGALDRVEIARDLDAIKALGFRAVTPQAGVNMPFAYLSPEYFRFFQMLVEEAKKRDLRIWIVDEIGYPSGFAGGRFTSEHPELRMQTLGIAETIEVREGTTIDRIVPAATVAVTAMSDDGVSLPIPVAGGKIVFTAPSGGWRVVVVEHRFETSPTRSALNPKLATEPRLNTNNVQAKDRSESLEDYMNPVATRQFLVYTHEQYKKYLGQEFGKTIIGFRGDEPDYSVAGLPWTESFFFHFEQVKGYDVRPYLASFLISKGSVMSPEQTRARADYWDVFSSLFAENFFKVQADWCAANHLEYQVHIDSEERQMDLTRTDGDYFRDMRSVQVPGIDMTRHQIWTDTISDFPRLASSAGHVYGKPRAFTESFASARPMPDAELTRYILNEQIVRGVNLVELMYFPSSGEGGRPPMSYMNLPGFPALLDYVRRLSYLTTLGRPAASVALYLPSSSLWLKDESANASFVSAERLLSEHQIDFDIVGEDALSRDLIAGKGTLETLSGNRFHTVIVPSTPLLSETALERLRVFAADGGHVLFLGQTPSLIAGRTILNARPGTPSDFAWARTTSSELPPTPTPSDDPPSQPPAPQAIPAEILQAVLEAVPLQDVTLEHPNTAMRVLHRRWKDADVYLFFNEGAAKVDDSVILTGKAKGVEQWDPQAGTIAPLAAQKSRAGITVKIALKGYETLVLVAR